MKLFNLFFVAVVATLSFGLVYAVEPPAPEPPAWDRSSIQVEGQCINSTAFFTITNSGSGNMAGVSEWYLVQKNGGASSCGADVSAGYVLSDVFMLNSGISTFVKIKTGEYAPPYRLCVAQRVGHPGTGWASATVEESCAKPTSIEVADEPVQTRKIFIPFVQGD